MTINPQTETQRGRDENPLWGSDRGEDAGKAGKFILNTHTGTTFYGAEQLNSAQTFNRDCLKLQEEIEFEP